VLCVVTSLFAAACGDDDDGSGASATTQGGDTATTAPAAENTASDTGVTEDSIKVVILGADLRGLIAAGAISGVPENSDEINAKRYSYYFDQWNEAGGINGRTIDYQLVTWDPADPTTFDTACQKITLDIKPFMVVNPGGGFNTDMIPCITSPDDGDTTFFALDPVGIATFEASGKNLIDLAPPSEILAEAGASAAIETEGIAKDAKVGILVGDYQFALDARDRVKAVLEAAGIDVAYDDPVGLANLGIQEQIQNVRLAVPEMQQAGVDHVIMMLPFTYGGAFPTEAEKSGLDVTYTLLEISAGQCYAFAANIYPAALDGATCVTAFDNNRLTDKLEVKQDTPFEAECRTEFETYREQPSTVGIPFGLTKDGQGNTLTEDQPYFECGYVQVIKTALENAGADLTHESLFDALTAITDFEVAGASDGKGSFGPDKPFALTAMHIVKFVAGDFTSPKDAKGLYGGKCLNPGNCFQVVTPEVWTPIEATL
jgi:hypothetical protein